MTDHFKIILISITVMFYIPAGIGLSSSTLNFLFNNTLNNSANPVCGCKDESCCCGAPCCAPKPAETPESSCCGSSEILELEETPINIQMAWKATCTCGGSHAEHGAIIADPQLIISAVRHSFWLASFAKDSSYIRHWSSIQPAPPEQVPKIII